MEFGLTAPSSNVLLLATGEIVPHLSAFRIIGVALQIDLAGGLRCGPYPESTQTTFIVAREDERRQRYHLGDPSFAAPDELASQGASENQRWR